MKNLVGTVPLAFYQLNNDGYRTALHGPGDEYSRRLPRVIVDLNRARPIHFALIDGIRTSEGGEGPWIEGWNPKKANVLIAAEKTRWRRMRLGRRSWGSIRRRWDGRTRRLNTA